MTDANKAATGNFAALLGAAGSAKVEDVTVADRPEKAPAVSTGMASSSSSVLGTKVDTSTVKVPAEGYKSALVSRLGKVKPTIRVKGVHYYSKEDVDGNSEAKARAEALISSGRLVAY